MRTTGVANDLVQQNLLGDAIDSGPVAIFVADDDGRYLAVSEYACTLLGYTRGELLDLNVTDVAVNPGALEDYEQMKRNGAHVGLTVLRHRDGTELPMSFRATRTTVGGMTVYVGACWPVATRRRPARRRRCASAHAPARRRRTHGRAVPAASGAT